MPAPRPQARADGRQRRSSAGRIVSSLVAQCQMRKGASRDPCSARARFTPRSRRRDLAPGREPVLEAGQGSGLPPDQLPFPGMTRGSPRVPAHCVQDTRDARENLRHPAVCQAGSDQDRRFPGRQAHHNRVDELERIRMDERPPVVFPIERIEPLPSAHPSVAPCDSLGRSWQFFPQPCSART